MIAGLLADQARTDKKLSEALCLFLGDLGTLVSVHERIHLLLQSNNQIFLAEIGA